MYVVRAKGYAKIIDKMSVPKFEFIRNLLKRITANHSNTRINLYLMEIID